MPEVTRNKKHFLIPCPVAADSEAVMTEYVELLDHSEIAINTSD